MAKEKLQQTCPVKKTSIGGQALMEGIMMRGPKKSAMAVRNAKGEIVLETSFNKEPSKLAKIPFIRGIINMATSLAGGYKYLMRSADIALADAEEEDRRLKEAKEAAKKLKKAEASAEAPVEEAPVEEAPVEKTEEAPQAAEGFATVEAPDTFEVSGTVEAPDTFEVSGTVEVKEPDEATEAAEPSPEATEATEAAPDATKATPEKAEKKKENSAATAVVMIIGVILGVALAIGLFIALPSYLFKGFAWLANIDTSAITADNYGMNLLRSVFEGVFKIIILVLYMLVVSRMKEIRRVFMYHGAEHKTIFCYEAGLDLTVDNIRGQRRFHPRCGTSFIILVLLVSIVLGFFIPATLDTWVRILIKIALLPLTIGIGYELIKLAGRKDNWFTRMISAPGVWLQHITTVEPDDSMIECAIAAMNEVIPEDKTSDNW